MHKGVQRTVRDIKSLRIQGARNIAREAVMALMAAASASRAKSAASLYKELLVASEALSGSRPTEPMMRNLLDDACRYAGLRAQEAAGVAELKRSVLDRENGILKRMDEDKKRLAEYGAQLIPEGALVITHCHSSTVTGIIMRAQKIGKGIRVVALETRPRYQGRITAAELAEAGVDVTLVVDGAMNMHMKKADIVLVGADSISSRGDLINKVGTSTLAHIARMHDVSFYSAAELLKYSSRTIYGELERIEERDHDEVWDGRPKKVKVGNPAFDVTSGKYVSGYVTESGVLPPQSFFAIATQKLGIKVYE